MKDRIAIPLLTVLLVAALGCAQAEQEAQPVASELPAPIRGLMEAYNAHDAAAMLEYVTGDVEWLSVAGAEISVEARGRANLAGGMIEYFAELPSARAEIERFLVAGSLVTVVERAYWKVEDAEHSQASLAVYELQDDKIRRVWYYPAEE